MGRPDPPAGGRGAGLELFSAVFDKLEFGVNVYRFDDLDDPDSMVLVGSNPAASRDVGFDLGPYAGKPAYDAFPGLRDHPAMAAWLGAVVRGEPTSWSLFYVDANVAGGYFQTDSLPLDDRHFMTVFQRITERVEAVKALERRTWELERSNRDLEQFAYVASHDLQAPLRAISGFMDLIVDGLPDGLPTRLADFRDRMLASVDQLRRVIDGLLVYARVQRQALPMADEVSLSELADEVSSQLAPVLAEAGLEVTCTDLPTVQGDHVQLSRVFQNLVANAARYRAPARPGRLAISAETSGGNVVLRFEDEGIGIPAHLHERVFELFTRAHRSSEYPGSSGLGLALVKRIVDQHGGRAWLTSEVDVGTTVFVSLPLRQPRATP